ncbi:Mob1-like protein [Artemisia annua]|uniref:Mob1-like protein n=1 Tax=Artemisia annua TaxID=35608 RepID=A0A2U1LQ22_ARTAN|nr:Mob1-like protein [Artemisia annua]
MGVLFGKKDTESSKGINVWVIDSSAFILLGLTEERPRIEVPCASHPTERPSKRRTTMRPRSATHNTLDTTATASTTRKRAAHPTRTSGQASWLLGSPPTPIIVGTQTRTSSADSKQERAGSPAPFLVFRRIQKHAIGGAVNGNGCTNQGQSHWSETTLSQIVEKGECFVRKDWEAVDFFNQVNLLYGTLIQFYMSSTCPTIIAGAKHENRWADGVTIKKPIVVSAPKKAAKISCCLLDDNSCTEKVPASNFYSASSKIGFQGLAMD